MLCKLKNMFCCHKWEYHIGFNFVLDAMTWKTCSKCKKQEKVV